MAKCTGCGAAISTYVAQHVYTCYCGFVNAPARCNVPELRIDNIIFDEGDKIDAAYERVICNDESYPNGNQA